MVKNTLVVFITVFVISILLAEMYQTLVVPIEKRGQQERRTTSQALFRRPVLRKRLLAMRERM